MTAYPTLPFAPIGCTPTESNTNTGNLDPTSSDHVETNHQTSVDAPYVFVPGTPCASVSEIPCNSICCAPPDVPRHLYSLTAPPPKPRKRKASEAYDTSDSGAENDLGSAHLERRAAAMRRLRVEGEQRRRDELRDAYSCLHDALPPSKLKISKTSLVHRGEYSNFTLVV